MCSGAERAEDKEHKFLEMLLHNFLVLKAHLLSFPRCVRDEMGRETDTLVQQQHLRQKTEGLKDVSCGSTYARANRGRNN